MTNVPIACTLPPDGLREGLLPDLLRQANHHELTADGLRVRLSAESETLAAIVRVVEAERQCCRFLRFGITVEPDGGPISLDSPDRPARASSSPACSIFNRGASPLGLPDTLSRAPRRRRAPFAWLARALARGAGQLGFEIAS